MVWQDSNISAQPSRSFVLAWEHSRCTGQTSKPNRQFLRDRLSSYSISRYITVNTSQTGGLKWLDLDTVEQRYLLTAAADTTVEAFDILTSHAATGGHQPQQLQPVFTLKRGHPSAHRYQVTSIAWYPVDTGLFVTGSADQHVKVWDTNMLEVACDFECPDKVNCVGMSSCATSHALIAVGTKNPLVQLADVVSGAFSHTLTGHKTGVWSVCWSPGNEYHIYTGDASGEVRLWDVRRSGCRALLDLNLTQRPKSSARPTADPDATAGRARSVGLSTSNRARAEPKSSAATAAAAGHSSSSTVGARGIQRRASGEAAGPTGDPINDRSKLAGATRALAHEGPITGIFATLDGLNLVTAGADNRVRLWDSQYLHNRLVHYAETYNRGAYPKRLSSTPDGKYLFYPRGDDIQVFDIMTGQQTALLSQGHYDTVTACVYSPLTNQLYSCSIDGAVLAWEPWKDEPAAELQQQPQHQLDMWLVAAAGRRAVTALHAEPGGSAAAGRTAARTDVDAWSEDDDLVP